MLFFPIKLVRDQWSLFVVAALPYFGKKGRKVPILNYFDPSGSYGNHADVVDRSNKIRQLINLLWRHKISSKVDKFKNPCNKRSLPLKWFKSETIFLLFVWEFFKFWKISWYYFIVSSRSSGNFSNSEKFPDTLFLNHGIFQIPKNIPELTKGS